MNTPAHLIFGMTAFGRPERTAVTLAALIGALLPDLSLYLLSGTHLFILGTSPSVVFNELYFSDAWQSIFRIDNSIVLWGLVLIAGLWARWPVVVALAGGALLHLALDLPLHHDDGRAHFWPISDWVFESPVSYWDPDHYGGIVGLIEAVLVLLCCVFLWRRFRTWVWRAVIALLGVMEVLPIFAWLAMSASG